MTSSTILVTGATGNVGRPLVEALRAAGADVLAGSRSGEGVAGVPGRRVDFTDAATLREAFDGVGTLFLLFPLVPAKRELARSALVAARDAGVGHVVRSSGAGADPDAPGSLARLQGEIDRMVQASGIASTLVRPASFMQNWITYYGAMIRAGEVYLPFGRATSAWIDVRDIAAADAAILLDPAAHAGKTYTLTGPAAFGVAEGLASVAAETGRHARYVPVDEAAAVGAMQGAGMDAWTVDILTSLNREIAAGTTATTTPDVERLTGRPPRSFREFVRDHAGAW